MSEADAKTREKADFVPDDVYSTAGPTCPHCAYEITPDEGYYYDDRYREETCPDCGLTYDVEVEHTTTWTTSAKRTPDP